MTQHFKQPAQHRGGAPVGHLAELPDVERGAVLFLRKWCGGDEDRARIASDFVAAFGPEQGGHLACLHDALMRLVLACCRRPLMRHADGCACVGGDEMAFAMMVASAASGDVEDATLLAITLLSAPVVQRAVELAEPLGLAYSAIFTPLGAPFLPRPDANSHR